MKAERPRSIGAIQKRPKLYFLLPAAPDPTHAVKTRHSRAKVGAYKSNERNQLMRFLNVRYFFFSFPKASFAALA
jgi:hypothetical protein